MQILEVLMWACFGTGVGVVVGTVLAKTAVGFLYLLSDCWYGLRKWFRERDERAYAQRDDPVQSFHDWKRQKK